jgi:integrase
MASIRKRTWTSGGERKEAWILDYFGNETPKKRHIETFEKKKEAEARLDQIKAELRQGTHTADSASKTVGEIGDLWIQQAEADGLEVSTIQGYRINLDKHIRPFLGTLKLSKLTTPMVSIFRNRLRSEGRSPALTKKILVSLYGLVAHAVSHGMASHNPVVGARNSRRRKQEKRQKKGAISKEDARRMKDDVRAILAKVPDRYRPLLLTAVFTGLRASELRGLSWDNVDLAASTLTVSERADFQNTIGAPKSATSHREIPLPPIVVNTLRQWRLVCPRRRTDGALDLVFPNGMGKVYSQSAFDMRVFNPLQIEAGVVREITDRAGNRIQTHRYRFHDLRHFAASMFIETAAAEGKSMKWVQEKMGHSSIVMTMDLYGHLWPDDKGDQNAAAGMQARLLG